MLTAKYVGSAGPVRADRQPVQVSRLDTTQHRSTQRRIPEGRIDEVALTQPIVDKAREHGRYGYRWVTALLRADGWHVNPKRVERVSPVECPLIGLNA